MRIPKSYRSKKIRFGVSKTHEVGMFAGEKIIKGERILTWGGRMGVDYINLKKVPEALKAKKHIVQWGEDLFSIEGDGDDPNYYINHSCDPNVWLINYFSLAAKRNIKKGEELTVDYSTWETSNFYSKWKCLCGSKTCRQIITGAEWKDKKFQKKYRGHFSPLVQKLIQNNV